MLLWTLAFIPFLLFLGLVFNRQRDSVNNLRRKLNKKRVLITGSSSGIGEQLAYQYARHGCRLILAARSINILKNTVARECARLGAEEVHSVEFDASEETNCSSLINEVRNIYDGLDILVLNHTASVYQPLFDDDTQTIIHKMKQLMSTNFFGYFYTG